MDEARDSDASSRPVDHYLLQFWPARDRVLRRTGAYAAYWHGLDDGSAEPTIEQRVAAVRESRARRLAAEGEDDEVWGGWDDTQVVDVPDDMMVMPHLEDGFDDRSPVDRLAARDPGLVVALIGVDEETRRAVARWAAGDALAAAGIADEPWVQELLHSAGNTTVSISIAVEGDADDGWALRSAVEAASHAGRPDTLSAACGALWRHDPDDDVLLRVRREFRGLSREG
jgi:hypothetical protein